MKVYGLDVSYFTGKLEAVLRYKAIPYERVAMTSRDWNRLVPGATGAMQMPAVLLPDGRWMTDTTPIIAWLDGQHPEPRVIPSDPLQAFVSRLVEDYADEWLWRPAMHYRWSHRADARVLAERIAAGILSDIPGPAGLKRWLVYHRQRGRFVRGDGVTAATRAHVEGVYLRTLDTLEGIFAARAFLLGDRPTLADFGFFGSMFRHFGSDPTPAAIMRDRAPGVYEWLARTWNARAERVGATLVAGIPADWGPILGDVGAAYLPYLCANADAHRAGRRRFDVTIQGTTYRSVPTSRYRVWCLEELRRHHDALPPPVRAEARALLERHGCWEPIWRTTDLRSGHDPEGRVPFGAGLAVFAR